MMPSQHKGKKNQWTFSVLNNRKSKKVQGKINASLPRAVPHDKERKIPKEQKRSRYVQNYERTKGKSRFDMPFA